MNTTNNDNFFYKLNDKITNHKILFISFLLNFFNINMSAQNSFLESQLKYERFKNAYQNKNILLKNELEAKGFSYPPKNILFISYKAEGELQVWIKKNERYEIFKVYDVCKKSGDFGPKRAKGDKQVPEGFYKLNIFNPVSDYHLSLGLNYPNESDKIISSANNLGGDIYIHGSCVTVGCLPMTDDIMEEIYMLAVLSKNSGLQEIPIYLFPFKFNKLTEYIFYKEYPQHIALWENIKSEYYYFKRNKKIRNITVNSVGNYIFKE